MRVVSGAVSSTFGFGEAGAGVGTLAIVAVSWLAPVSITRTSPARGRGALKPDAGRARGGRLVQGRFDADPQRLFPELSTARYRTVVLPCWVIDTVAVTDGPGVTGTST